MNDVHEPSVGDLARKLDELEQRHEAERAELRRRIDDQDREIASLRGARHREVTPPPLWNRDSPSEHVVAEGSDRRRFLKGAAVAAAGAGFMLVNRPEAAAAADGSNLVLGTGNTSTSTTVLTSSAGRAFVLLGAAGLEGVNSTCNGPSGYGVLGFSDTGYGVRGQSNTGYALHATGTNPRIGINGSTYASAPTSGSFVTGDILKDAVDELWLCTVSGTPGTWRRLGGPGSAGQLQLLSTVQRRVNTLNGTGIAVGTMATNTSRTTTNIATALGFATNEITGVMASVTAYPPGAAGTFPTSGYLGVAGNYTATPSLTVTAGQSFMTGLVLSSLVTGTLTIAAFATPVDITIDIIGYYR